MTLHTTSDEFGDVVLVLFPFTDQTSSKAVLQIISRSSLDSLASTFSDL